MAANLAAWTSVLTAESVPDPELPVTLAKRAVATEPRRHAYLNTLGAALYRAGRLEDAVRWLSTALLNRGNETAAHEWLFLAMAQHRLGRAAEAQRSLENARSSSPSDWTERLELDLLRREAEGLIASH